MRLALDALARPARQRVRDEARPHASVDLGRLRLLRERAGVGDTSGSRSPHGSRRHSRASPGSRELRTASHTFSNARCGVLIAFRPARRARSSPNATPTACNCFAGTRVDEQAKGAIRSGAPGTGSLRARGRPRRSSQGGRRRGRCGRFVARRPVRGDPPQRAARGASGRRFGGHPARRQFVRRDRSRLAAGEEQRAAQLRVPDRLELVHRSIANLAGLRKDAGPACDRYRGHRRATSGKAT